MSRKLRAIATWSPLAMVVMLCAIVAAFAATGASADNVDQSNIGARYAWGENIGWLKARPSAESYGAGGSGLQVTDTDVLGYVWGENIGWVNFSCQNDASCGGAAGNWGVKNDGAGHLSGYAWGENVGWINFSCTTNATCGAASFGVSISLPGSYQFLGDWGHFSGQAWGENVGWINFGDGVGLPASVAIQTGWPDSDGDGCRDSKESAAIALQGGQRDPFDPYDFYDVPYPPLRRNPAGTRDGGIGITMDVVALLAYAGLTSTSADYLADYDGNGVADGLQYDRQQSANPAQPWRSGPPDGGIGITGDVVAMLKQTGTVCT